MTAAASRDLVEQYFAAVNAGAFDRFPALFTADFHNYFGTTLSSADLASFVRGLMGFRAAFPDACYTLDDLVADDSGHVALRWHGAGTHTAAWQARGLAATGLHVTWSAIGIYHLREGRFATGWVHNDMERVRQELETAAASGTRPATPG